jgi:predicted naringenin-chalcone synthase
MFITGVGTAVPGQRYTQAECWDAIRASPQYANLNSRSHAILRKVLLGNNGIESRRLALDPIAEAFNFSPDAMLARFKRVAPEIGETAAKNAMSEAGISAADVDALVVATCTGYLCPGLSSYIGERLGLPRHAQLLDLVGLGCGAAVPALRTSAALLGDAKNVLTICVEVCSAAVYLDDDPGVLISACLFGDGAAAVVGSREARPHSREVRWLRAESLHAPEYREMLRFDHRQGLLRNILAPEVPELSAGYAAEVFRRAGGKIEEVSEWLLHSGGRDVLGKIGAQLGLPQRALRHSAEVLREYGNMSSPSCIFALRRALDEKAGGGQWWLASFGAGFSSHGALLSVQ